MKKEDKELAVGLVGSAVIAFLLLLLLGFAASRGWV